MQSPNVWLVLHYEGPAGVFASLERAKQHVQDILLFQNKKLRFLQDKRHLTIWWVDYWVDLCAADSEINWIRSSYRIQEMEVVE